MQRVRECRILFQILFLNRDPFSVGCPTLSLKKSCLRLQLQQLKDAEGMPNPFSNFVFEQRSVFSWLPYTLSQKKKCSLCLQLQQLKVCIARLAEMQNGDRAAADTSKALPLM
jgi:hypothetical protein